ncbi:hypothetical protein [Dankookia sp. GCM10030260]
MAAGLDALLPAALHDGLAVRVKSWRARRALARLADQHTTQGSQA